MTTTDYSKVAKQTNEQTNKQQNVGEKINSVNGKPGCEHKKAKGNFQDRATQWDHASKKINSINRSWVVVAHAFNPSTCEAEAGRFLSARTAWCTMWFPGQPRLYRETLSRKTKKNK